MKLCSDVQKLRVRVDIFAVTLQHAEEEDAARVVKEQRRTDISTNSVASPTIAVSGISTPAIISIMVTPRRDAVTP
jgi:hypothetical protein